MLSGVKCNYSIRSGAWLFSPVRLHHNDTALKSNSQTILGAGVFRANNAVQMLLQLEGEMAGHGKKTTSTKEFTHHLEELIRIDTIQHL